jgi:Mrp family chromosome partitioning ATPase
MKAAAMSKITQALEKAARERLQAQREPAIVPSTPVTVPIAPVIPATPFVESRIREIAEAGEIQVDPHIVSAADSTSAVAEQYRILKFNLQALEWRLGPKTIVVTSALNGEGKSVTAINLALTLARQEHLRVLLLDADLRRSSMNRWLGLPEQAKGVSTALHQGGVVDGSLVRLQTPSLTILPAGPSVEHPTELLASSSMKRLLASL